MTSAGCSARVARWKSMQSSQFFIAEDDRCQWRAPAACHAPHPTGRPIRSELEVDAEPRDVCGQVGGGAQALRIAGPAGGKADRARRSHIAEIDVEVLALERPPLVHHPLEPAADGPA